MRAIAPRLPWPERHVGANQLEYAELVVATVEHHDGTKALVTRWRLTAADLTVIQPAAHA